MKRAGLLIFMTVGWLAFVFMIAESYVRLVADTGMDFHLEMWKYARDVKQVSEDPLISHEHAANRHAKLMGVDFRTNSRGLRDREFSYERTPGVRRVLMLGDSLTVGWGVAVEETFSKRIERMYEDLGVPTEVINTGVGNYNTIQQVEYFMAEGYKYRPDVVVLNYFVNDAEPVPPQQQQPSFVMRNCYSCVFIAGRTDTVVRLFSGESDWASYYLSLYGNGTGSGWLQAKDSIRRLADYCKKNNIALLIVSLPELHDIRHYRFQLITDLVRVAAEENGAQFVDALTFFGDVESAKLWVTPPDPHPNGYANAFIAKGIFDAMRRMER